MLALDMALKRLLKINHFIYLHIIEIAFVGGEQTHPHRCDRHRGVLLLLHNFGAALPAFQLFTGGLVKIGGKL